MKTCPRCKRDLDIKCFAIDRSRADERKSACKDCDNKAAAAYYAANKSRKAAEYAAASAEIAAAYQANRVQILQARRDRRYGLGPGGWVTLRELQDGKCYLCEDPLPEDPAKVATEHDRSCCPGSGSCGRCVRGLSCVPCNTLIARANDDPARLRRIAGNLERALTTTRVRAPATS